MGIHDAGPVYACDGDFGILYQSGEDVIDGGQVDRSWWGGIYRSKERDRQQGQLGYSDLCISREWARPLTAVLD